MKSLTRRSFILSTAGAMPFWSSGCQTNARSAARTERPNILLITADDLNYDSAGCYGCPVPDITPNIDLLAQEGIRFTNAHVNIAVCQPCRQSLMTGRYPHNNGAEGFDPIDLDVPTLQELLHGAGYINGIMGKEIHLRPKEKFCWDFYVTEGELASGAGIGRSPERYAQYAKQFFESAKEQKKPFFLMANAHDPHRPFAGSQQEQASWGHDLPNVSRWISGDEIAVPHFLPDLPKVRQELAEYYTSVYRCDQVTGAVLHTLAESGYKDNTLVLFLSDNGMSFPFAKANCYLASTKTPWIVRWPGKVAPGSVDREHFVSGVDYMPTMMQAAGISPPDGMDGLSFLPLLFGQQQQGRTHVFTEFHRTFARQNFPMRCVQNARFGYIINFWAGKTKPMRMDSTSGLTFNALQEAGKTDPAIAKRVSLFEYRVLEEFYDFQEDPGALKNLIDSPGYQTEIDEMRRLLEEHLARTHDPASVPFVDRYNPDAIDRFLMEQEMRSMQQ